MSEGKCLCGAAAPSVGFVGQAKCAWCGLVWEYEEGPRPTKESLMALMELVWTASRQWSNLTSAKQFLILRTAKADQSAPDINEAIQ